MFSFRLAGRAGDDVDHANARRATLLSLQPSVEARIGRHLNLSLSHSMRRLSRGGDEIRDAGLTQGQIVYHFTSRALVRAIMQYQNRTATRRCTAHLCSARRRRSSRRSCSRTG
ncbi:MAG TPA: hypothetical protein VHG08_25690 [Longimicrobium sp.]|nr:hypothetical protein [Longimicrobium sp.]